MLFDQMYLNGHQFLMMMMIKAKSPFFPQLLVLEPLLGRSRGRTVRPTSNARFEKKIIK